MSLITDDDLQDNDLSRYQVPIKFLFLTPPQKMEIISTLSVLSLSETSEMWTRVL